MSLFSRPISLLTVTMLLLGLSAGVNVIQAQRIRSIVGAVPVASKLIGRRAVTLSGFSLAGEPRDEPLHGKLPTVVYYFSRSCKWCEMNWPSVQTLANGATGRYRLVAVSPDRGLGDYLATHKLTVDVIEGLTKQTRDYFGFSGTPRTVVVSSDGLITHDWIGMFAERNRRQIEDLFDLSLPTISVQTVGRTP